MSAEKTSNPKFRGLSMWEVSKGTSITYPTVLKWARGGKIHHMLEKQLTKYIEENGTK